MDLATKKMQTSAKKACFQFAEYSFSGAMIRLFLVTSKDLGKNVGMRRKKKIGDSRYVREPPGNLFWFNPKHIDRFIEF